MAATAVLGDVSLSVAALALAVAACHRRWPHQQAARPALFVLLTAELMFLYLISAGGHPSSVAVAFGAAGTAIAAGAFVFAIFTADAVLRSQEAAQRWSDFEQSFWKHVRRGESYDEW